MTKYYFAGASRIAVRKYIVPQSSTLTYLAGDHLGSTSLAVDASTGDVIQTRYKPWGEVRYTTPSKTLPTRYTFTGQYSYVSDDATDLGAAGFGLMFYNARWYDPALGRMIQADSIVPPGLQGFDRYAYVANNPIIYTDPSGHAQYRSGYQSQIHAKNVARLEAQRLARIQAQSNFWRCQNNPMCDNSGVPPRIVFIPSPDEIRCMQNPGCDASGVPAATTSSTATPSIVCSSSMCNPNAGGVHYIPRYKDGAYNQSQGSNGDACGPYSVAMARNMYYGSSTCPTNGAYVEFITELKGLKIPGLGIPSWGPVDQIIIVFIPDATVTKEGDATTDDLVSALAKGNIVIVIVSWLTTRELNLEDSPGHYMVAVGYDDKGLYFLNPGESPATNGVSYYSFGDFNHIWNETSNIFISPGTMWVISSP